MAGGTSLSVDAVELLVYGWKSKTIVAQSWSIVASPCPKFEIDWWSADMLT